jgi:uncharacterized protein (TIGR02679 family)
MADDPAAHLPPGLARWARMTGPSRVLSEVRQRARRGFRTEHGALRLALSPVERAEVARVLGTRWDTSGRAVRLQDLAVALGEHGLTVRGFVEALDGEPLVDQREVRAQWAAAATAEQSAAVGLLSEVGVPADVAQTWLSDPGLPRAGTGSVRELAARSAVVMRRLAGPDAQQIRLAQLAADLFDDSHALDYRTELGRAVSRLAALRHGLPRPRRPGREWRAAWAAVGVQCDTVSSRVLALNLRLTGDAPAVRLTAAAGGEPVWLSLRSLRGPWSAVPDTVFVCENPTVAETAADELGPRCPPLVCTDGIPSIAALDLLAGLGAAGCGVRVRADIDDAGFVVVDQVRAVASAAATWRFDAPTYARSIGLDIGAGSVGSDEVERIAVLRELYSRHGVPLYEEALLDDLLADLGG